MCEVKLQEADVLSLYKETTDAGKRILTNRLGVDFFKPKEITGRIKTLADVFAITQPCGDVEKLLNYTGTNRMMIGAKNFILAELIAEAYNEGWVPNWKDTNEKKWSGWFDGSNNFAFSSSLYSYWHAGTYVGSRLVFKSEKLLLDAVKKFPEIYREILTK